jgi:hypothetical protein
VISTSYTNKTSVHKKLYGIAGLLVTLAFPFFVMLGDTDGHLDTAQSFCPLKMLTGFPCPGCGITKAMVYFYRGDVAKSLHYHILGPFAVLASVFLLGMLCTELATGKRYLRSVIYNRRLGYALAVLLVGYHITRLFFFVRDHSLDDILRQSLWK